MFSAMWPERPDEARYNRRSVLQGYLESSVIVRGESSSPEGPYELKETVLAPRGSGYWDVVCCHNPCIVKVGGQYALFFQTCGEPGEPRRIGYATSASVYGPWTHASEAIPFPDDSVNPSVWVEPDGSLLMAFRIRPMRLAVARAPSLAGPWRICNADCMPHYGLEDPFLFHWRGQYHIVIEDACQQVTGDMRNGIRLVSDDGENWSFYSPEIRAYGAEVTWTNGVITVPARRERPWLIVQDGEPTHLVNGVMFAHWETFRTQSVVTPLQ
jgi:hypothetical protein